MTYFRKAKLMRRCPAGGPSPLRVRETEPEELRFRPLYRDNEGLASADSAGFRTGSLQRLELRTPSNAPRKSVVEADSRCSEADC